MICNRRAGTLGEGPTAIAYESTIDHLLDELGCMDLLVLELFEAIVEREPASIRELARLVDRHPPEVPENAHELADYGLIEHEDEGRAKRPTVRYDEFEFSADVPLNRLDSGSDTPFEP